MKSRRFLLTLVEAVVVVGIAGTCHAARLENTYLPPGSAAGAGGGGFISAPNRPVGGGGGGGPGRLGGAAVRPGGHGGSGTPGGFGPAAHGGTGGGGGRPSGQGGSPGGAAIPIISFNSENTGDGSYQFSYATGNGITAEETGQTQGESEVVSGSYSYTGPDGVEYTVRYTADAEGFHPQGAHLPTPPPIPPEIQRGVELSLAAEARGENQDGGGAPGPADRRYSGTDHSGTPFHKSSTQSQSSEGYRY